MRPLHFSTRCVVLAGGSRRTAAAAVAVLALAASAPTATAQSGTPEWRSEPAVSVEREHHSATRLADGRVLVVGGYNEAVYAQPEIFAPAPAGGGWTGIAPAGSYNSVAPAHRGLHAACVLGDGRVLIAGGLDDGGVTASSAVYDPADGSWALTATTMSGPRIGHSLTFVPGVGQQGRVVAVGGNGSDAAVTYDVFDVGQGRWLGGAAIPDTAPAGHTIHPL